MKSYNDTFRYGINVPTWLILFPPKFACQYIPIAKALSYLFLATKLKKSNLCIMSIIFSIKQ